MQSSPFGLRVFSITSYLIVAFVISLAGISLAQSAQAATFEITAVTVDKVDALGKAAEDVRSFGITFSSPAKDIDLGIWKKEPSTYFFSQTIAGPVTNLYISPGNWTNRLEPNTTYRFTITANAATTVTSGSASDAYYGEFTTSNFVPAKPDFIVDRLVFPEHPQKNEDITIDVYFKNIGGPCSYSCIGSWVIDPLFNTGNFAISYSEDTYVQQGVLTWPTGGIDHVKLHGHFVRSGQFQLIAQNDNGNNVSELDETNNLKSAYIFVQPDLTWQLIKSASSPVIYWYSKNTRARHYYPDEATYHSWFPDFRNISTLSDSDMGTIPLGSMVRVKPGTMMVKIKTDPKVYAVDVGGTLRWIKTEALAQQLYGTNWNKQVIDVDVSLFGRYNFGQDISSASEFNVYDVMTRSLSIDSVIQ